MTVPIEILVGFLSAGLGLQAWVLIEVVKLKVKVAVLAQRIEDAGL
jgi:hypothetical protein